MATGEAVLKVLAMAQLKAVICLLWEAIYTCTPGVVVLGTDDMNSIGCGLGDATLQTGTSGLSLQLVTFSTMMW